MPFAFKPYCLAEARDAGAELALWLDSSCVAVRRLERIADGLDYEAVKLNRGRRVSRDPRVRGHRHDQTVAGPLAYRLGMHLTNHGLSVSPHVPRVASPRTLIVNLRAARRRWPALARRLVRPARR